MERTPPDFRGKQIELVALAMAVRTARADIALARHRERVPSFKGDRDDQTVVRYTQEDLAHDAGLTASSIGRLESARGDARWSTVWAVINALGLTAAEFGERVDAQKTSAAKAVRAR